MRKDKRSEAGETKFRNLLLSRYLLIVIFAILFIPIILVAAATLAILGQQFIWQDQINKPKYESANQMEQMWHREAAALAAGNPGGIDRRLEELKERYPEASMFWADEAGRTRLVLSERPLELPELWTPQEAIRFMKRNVGGDPFTVVAFIGENNEGPAFMVLQMPRALFQTIGPTESVSLVFYLTFIAAMFVLFVMLSLLFFRHIRRRLIRLQTAMALRGADGLPEPITVNKADEIGQLESAFNRMVGQLQESRRREQEEEELRKRLISNLSHDLRTPLTVMNGHVYALRQENLTDKGRGAVKLLSSKIEQLGGLIDNLLSYTLMTSGKYPLKPEELDILRLVRETAAAWYPLWEKEGIDADVDLEAAEGSLRWRVDREGFRRVLDNLFQNVVRHAADGGYIGITVAAEGESKAIVITDRGAGRKGGGKGAGIGLAIVDYLLREMALEWRMERTTEGTRVTIFPKGKSANAKNAPG